MSKLRNSTRFIEFYGLPGIGKTTVVKELQSNSKLNGKKNIIFIIGTNSFNISSFIRKCYFVTTLLIKRKGNLKILIEIYNSGQDSVLTFLKLAFNFLWIESLYMYYKDKNKIVVLDQGLIQAYWSLLYSSKKEIKLKYKNYSYNILSVFLCVDYSIWEKRIMKRNSKRSRLRSEEVNKKKYNQYLNLFSTSKTHCIHKDISLKQAKEILLSS